MQIQRFDVTALYFKLPFNKDVGKEVESFCKKNKVALKIMDCTKGKLFEDYLSLIKNAKHGRGVGVNPCVDCRIFILKEARKFADKKKIELIVSGEVVGERPMSQMKRKMDFIEEKSKLKGRLLRPLSAKLLQETETEKLGIVNRKKLSAIQGRQRREQIKLARKFKIDYPSPSGGCFLCERALKKRFEFLLQRGLRKEEVKFVGIGRHFLIDNCWVVLGRNKKENKIIESSKKMNLVVPDFFGPSAVILDKFSEKTEKKVWDLIKAYSRDGSLQNREKFERYKL